MLQAFWHPLLDHYEHGGFSRGRRWPQRFNRSNGALRGGCTEVDQIFHTSAEARRQGQINLHRDYEDGSMYDLSREQGLNLRGGRGGSRVAVLSEPGLPWRPQILADQLTLSQPGGGGGRLYSPHYYSPPQIFRPSDGPA